MESKKYNKLVTITKKKQIHNSREQTSGYQWGEGKGQEQYRDKGFFKRGVIMGLSEITLCEPFKNCKALWNLNTL